MSIEKELKVQTETLITISNGVLHHVVWRNNDGKQVFSKCEEMSADEIAHLLKTGMDAFSRQTTRG